jgi:uncharacterized UBP type Zn finger protein
VQTGERNGGDSLSFDFYDGTNKKYALVAMILHNGNVISSGHYYSIVHSPTTNAWYQCDDERVSALPNINHICGLDAVQRDLYVLIYEQE